MESTEVLLLRISLITEQNDRNVSLEISRSVGADIDIKDTRSWG